LPKCQFSCCYYFLLKNIKILKNNPKISYDNENQNKALRLKNQTLYILVRGAKIFSFFYHKGMLNKKYQIKT
jgi:hypothetical protein